MSTPLLDISDLTVEFTTRRGVVRAVETVSYSVSNGEMLGVVGESGSGKSVTSYAAMRILDRAGRIASGTVVYGGVDVTAAPEHVVADLRGREMSMIFQNPRAALNPIRKIGRQIEDVLVAHLQATRATAKAKAMEMLAQVRIADFERRYDAYPFELSGGMCQRVVIALALACRPKLLIADEPTTGLDVTTQKTIMDLIVELARARSMATILITHDLGLASAYCDRIVVMQTGQVVERGQTAEMFSNPNHPYTQKLIRATPRRDSVLRELLPLDADGAVPAAAKAMPRDVKGASGPMLAVHDLVKTYPMGAQTGLLDRLRGRETDTDTKAFRAVDGINFTLDTGESIGLVGESGCGKSTTSSIISRLIDATSGSVTFEGETITDTPAKDFARSPLRGAIQIVFQDPTESLNPRFPAARSIADPLMRIAGLSKRDEIRSRVEDLAAKVGLPVALLDRFPHQLSGGQKARVGIARAIALEPRLLILDEPTSALDVSVQAVVLNLLADLRATLDMSYIFVSHDLNVVRLLCDRVLVMRAGQIVEEGLSEQVLDAPAEDYTRSLVAAIPHFGGAVAAIG